MSCLNCKQVQIQDSIVRNTKSERSGGSIYIHNNFYNSNNSFEIKNSQFYNSTSRVGGAITLSNVDALVSNNLYESNFADSNDRKDIISRGGAINLECNLNSISCKQSIINNTFILNSATIKGGAISWIDVMPILINNTYLHNTAQYGNDISSFPIKLDHIEASIFNRIYEIAAGQLMNTNFQIGLFDHYNQIFSLDSYSTAKILRNNNTLISGLTLSKAKDGVFYFSDLKIYGKPNSYETILISTQGIDSNKSSTLSIDLHFRDCIIGEYRTFQSCEVCPQGKYSIDPSHECEECPVEAYCYGNYTMSPKEGFWRKSPYDVNFFECPISNVCLDGEEYFSLTGTCKKGYEGNICNTCEDTYSKLGKFICLECPSKTTCIILIIVILLILGFLFFITIDTSIKSALKSKSALSIYIKILLNYYLLMSEIFSIRMGWPTFYDNFLDIFTNSSDLSYHFFSFDCISKIDNQYDPYSNMRFKLISVILLPILFIALSAVFWYIKNLLGEKIEYIKDKVIGSIVIILTILHPIVMRFSFGVFSCVELEHGEYWLESDTEINCWKGEHKLAALGLGLPAMILWGLGIPCILLVLLLKARKILAATESMIRYGYLYNGYNPKTFYWEIIIILRKMLIVSFNVFLLSRSSKLQVLPIMLALGVSLILQMKIKPFTIVVLNRLETASIITANVTLYCGMYFLITDINIVIKYMLVVIVIGFNAGFMLYIMKYICLDLIRRIKNKLISMFYPNKFSREEDNPTIISTMEKVGSLQSEPCD